MMKIWPRGISKEKIDVWMKDLGTPSNLIKLWKSGKISWDKFATEYLKGQGKRGPAEKPGRGLEEGNNYTSMQ
jgi:uncharacterized protein YeaO (DUF488 family)